MQYNIAMKTVLQHFIIGIFSASLFSAFIYFEYFHLTNKLLNTIFALASLALLLHIPKRSVIIAGFFIGIFWFYWIGYSFAYQGVGYVTPFIPFVFGFIYALFFTPLALTNQPYLRAIFLFLLSFVEPMNFNWLNIELLFIESYIGIFKYQLFIVLLSLVLTHYLQKPYKYFAPLLLIVTLNITPHIPQEAPLRIKLVQTMIKQEDKWKREYLGITFQIINTKIEEAIKEGYDVVVLPESVFPIYMNKNKPILESLLQKSHQITIVAGSLISEKQKHYNVTYKFEDGNYTIAKKVVLVPFGEYIPLPKFARQYINDTFFAGASDFVGAKNPTDFEIKGIMFRNAICYEATTDKIYEGDVKYVIAISNNGWFTPSIEPILQNLLLRYYARKNNVYIYHSANMAGTTTIF